MHWIQRLSGLHVCKSPKHTFKDIILIKDQSLNSIVYKDFQVPLLYYDIEVCMAHLRGQKGHFIISQAVRLHSSCSWRDCLHMCVLATSFPGPSSGHGKTETDKRWQTQWMNEIHVLVGCSLQNLDNFNIREENYFGKFENDPSLCFQEFAAYKTK